ncbi:ubiquitin-like protein [Aureispira anguillae]|uniref:Ubiquitin-like domain-containing protein n=1 Tax=Aureispira anguillae TaxID=2864201 RepID=A0A915YHI0_9BACT|nr:ubiquitin-like protein [Aureispira anguillae]BDS13114.1 hypothetical protein AsAng_0038420 [Aureispira anguillae]
MTTAFKQALEELQLNLNRWLQLADSNSLKRDTASRYKTLLTTIDTALNTSNKPFQVFVKNYTGKTYTLDVSSDDSVPEIKSKIEDKLGVPASEQRLIVAGKQLDDNKSASAYQLQKESTIHVVLSLKGGDPFYVLCTTLGIIAIPTMIWLIGKCGSRKKAKDYLEENASNDEVLNRLRNKNKEELSSEDETIVDKKEKQKDKIKIETLTASSSNASGNFPSEEEKKEEKKMIKVKDLGSPMILAYSPKFFDFTNKKAREIAEIILQTFKDEDREFDSKEDIIAAVKKHPDIQKALGLDKEIKQLQSTIVEDCSRYGSKLDALTEYDVKHGIWEQITEGNKIRPEGDYQLVVKINSETYKYHVHAPSFPKQPPIPGEVMTKYGMSGTQTSSAVIKAILKYHPRPDCWDKEIVLSRKKD